MAESQNFNRWGSTCEEIIKSHFPLHRACRDGDVDALSSLLMEAQHGVYVEDSFYGWTPAHWAAYFGKLTCLMRLYENGTNWDSATIRLNQTPVHIAAFAGQGHCLKWLLHCGARIDRQLGCLRKLMQVTRVGADCDIKSSRFCQTPTHLAAFGGHPHCLQWLIQSGAAFDAQDYLGETPAHKAARTGSMECSSLLISHGARLYICNNSGLTPSKLALKCGFDECAKAMEAGEKRQASDPKGVYQYHQQNGTHAPSPHDITITPKNNDTVQAAGVNGHADPLARDCDMEEDMDASSQDNHFTDTALSRLFAQSDSPTNTANGDITTNHAISTNQLPVAGRKRSREDGEDTNFKRLRTSELVLNGHAHEHTGPDCDLTTRAAQTDQTNGTSMSPTDKQHCNHRPFNGSTRHVVGTVKGFVNCHSPHLHNGAFHDSDAYSSSAVEYQTSMLLAQGYDSMCYEALSHDLASNFY